MLSILALTLKKTITLLVLVGPVSMIPIFLASTEGFDLHRKGRFARTIGLSVTVALLAATFFGMPILGLLGVSLGAMQVGGGVIVLLLAIAMVLGKESTFKGSPSVTSDYGVQEAAIVPLAVPLLAGPAAFSYVMGNKRMAHFCRSDPRRSTYPCRGYRVLDNFSYGLPSGKENSTIYFGCCATRWGTHSCSNGRRDDGCWITWAISHAYSCLVP